MASLDAPTVAIVWSSGFAWAVHLRLPLWAPVMLALVAWAVYVGDRLLDAHEGMQTPPRHQLRDRHYFHWRHRRVLATCALLAAAGSLWIVSTRLPAAARVSDSAIAAATLVYFSGVHSIRLLSPGSERLRVPKFSRAFLIGVLFTAGCLLPVSAQITVAAMPASMGSQLLLPAMFYTTLGWLNCHAIGRWESSPASRAIDVERACRFMTVAGVLLATVLAAVEPRVALMIAAGAAAAWLLGLINRYRSRISPLAARAFADLVLLTPLFLMVPWHSGK